MVRRLAAYFAALVLVGISGAKAADKSFCSERYSLEEHAILEWAALGGDPHAQFAIAQCAYPDGAGKLSEGRKTYALTWLTLAACDASGSPGVEERDRLTRRLKYSSELSFRRFAGVTEDERFTARERQFVEYRRQQNADLEARLVRLRGKVEANEAAVARDALADRLARMGPLGLLRLAELSSCRYFDASPSLAAAAWSAADHAWKADEAAAVYGASMREGWSVADESARRLAALSPAEQRLAAVETARLLRTSPAMLAKVEEEAALGRMERLSSVHAGNDAMFPAGGASILAAQYALEALGFMQFVNGPDNDYGPSTIEAVRRAQAHYGAEETRWLSHRELRRVVCEAATKKSDPVSYYFLARMYAQGLGFSPDPQRARYAIERSEKILLDRLSKPERLEEWKREEYPKFIPLIASARAEIEQDGLLLSHHAGGERIGERNLCP